MKSLVADMMAEHRLQKAGTAFGYDVYRLMQEPAAKRTPDPLGRGLRDGDMVDFGIGQPGVAMLAEGWSGPEQSGTWATGTQSRLVLRLDGDAFKEQGAILQLATSAFLPPGVNSKMLDIFVGDAVQGQPIAQWSLENWVSEGQYRMLCIPAGAVAVNQPLTLTFRTDRSYSPSEATGTDDRRILDFFVTRLSVDAGPCPPTFH